MSPPTKASTTLQAGAARFRRLRLGVILLGVLVLLAFAGTCAYDLWRSHRHTVTATHREISNLAGALAEQTALTVQAVDLLLRDTARWYRDDAQQIAAGELDSVLGGRVAGARQVRLVTLTDAEGFQRHRSQGASPPDLNVSDRSYFIAQRDHPDTGLFISEPLVTRSTGRASIILSRRLEDTSGGFAGVVAAIVDLEDLQALYSAIDLGLGTSTYLLRENGTLLLRNPPALTQVGQTFPALAQASNSSKDDFINPIDGKREFVAVASVRDTPFRAVVCRDYQLALRPWSSEALSITLWTTVLTLLGALTIVAVLRQLHHIEASARALRDSEERYALAMEGANEGHWDWDIRSDRVFLSARMKTLQGLATDTEVTSRADWLSKVVIHPDDMPSFHAAVSAHLEGQTPRFECEYRTRHADGTWCWLLARGRCLRDAQGNAVRFVGSTLDVTAEKRAQIDKEHLEAQLRQSQKMEAIGTLAGGIAHDFNNILGAILGYGELAQQQAATGSAGRRYVDNVLHAAGRAKTLVDRILGFSRSGLGERVPVNIQFVVAETLELLTASLPQDIQLDTRLEAGNAAVLGDAIQLHQVTMNLCTNALQAMTGHGGTLTIVLDRTLLTETRAVSRGQLTPGDYVRLVIADTGRGIPPGVMERIFDPFFTTKGVGEGTGLGLSLVHGIVSDLRGGIDLHSQVGAGTRFEIWLPVRGEAPEPQSIEPGAVPLGNGQTVLIVDDEKALVDLSEETLAQLGYEPVGFESSPAALRAFQAQPDRFDVVLTDEAMPELTGMELARAIRGLKADIPIVLMSGHGGAQLIARAAPLGITEVLHKPLQSRELAEALARVLRVAAASDAATDSGDRGTGKSRAW